MTLPNFLLIGAGRSGTTSLYHYLRQHPQVFMSAVKEPNFFSAGPLVPAAGPGAAWARQSSISTLAQYEALFAGVTTETAIGEASPRYLRAAGAAERIHQAIPAARLVAILRHPVERAHVAYLSASRDGFDPAPTFAEAVRSAARGERDAWVLMQHTRSGLYHRSLTPYYRLFPRERIRVLLFDDLEADAAALVRGLFQFLEVDPDFRPDLSQRLAPTGVIRNPLLAVLWRRSMPLRRALRPFVPRRLAERANARVLRDVTKPPIDPEIRHELLQFYRADTLALQEMIGSDLSAWLR